MWLAIRNRCWTADRLQKRGLPHPERCPPCDQEEEMAQHIHTSYVFARQYWYAVLQPLNMVRLTPTRSVAFADWWMRAEKKLLKQHRKGFNTYCILGAWTSGNIGMLVFLKVHLQIYRQQSKLSKMTLTYGSLQGLKGCPPFASSWEETESRFLGSLGLVLSFF